MTLPHESPQTSPDQTQPAGSSPEGPPVQLHYLTPDSLAHPDNWTNLEVFELDPEKRSAYLRLVMTLQIAIGLLTLLVVATGVWLIGSALPFRVRLILALFAIAYLVVVQAIAGFRRVGIVTRKWSTFRLVIADQGLVMSSYMADKVTLAKNEIGRITDTWDAFKIELTAGRRRLLVPKRVAHLDRLRQRLASLHPIRPGKGLLGVIAQLATVWTAALLNVAAGYTGLYTGSRTVLVFCIAACLFLTGTRFITTWRNIGTPLSVRLSVLLLLILPAMMTVRFFIPGSVV